MNTQILYFAIIAMIFTSAESLDRGDYISIKEAPYFVSLIYKYNPYCGGAIISESWILTAAHCTMVTRQLTPYDPNLKLQVRTGSTASNSAGDVHDVEKVFIHMDYENKVHLPESEVGFNDIALYKLKTPIVFNEYKQPIKLNRRLPKILDEVTIIGLGSDGKNENTPSLKMSSFDSFPLDFVKLAKNVQPNVVFLRGFEAAVCPGDSGSPAVCNGELIGVLSGGRTCARWDLEPQNLELGIFAYYTRTDVFYDWIIEVTGIKY